MNKNLITILKVAVMLVIAALIAFTLHKSWSKVNWNQVQIDWRWGILAIVGFAGSMLTSALVWRCLAFKMSPEQARGKTLPLLACYTFSQMGKYIPGKVALLLMRIDRASRFGLSAGTTTLSTLLENALYMISGALVGMTAIPPIAASLNPRIRPFLWPVCILAVLLLTSACAPPVFYGLVNRLLKKMNRPAVPRDHWLSAPTLIAAVVAFLPVWLFGGLALWASAHCVHAIPLPQSWWFPGAFALSVIIGMASLLPGGTGIREAVLGGAAAIQFMAAGMPQPDAVVLGSVVAVLQRIFQVIVEILLGSLGALITGMAKPPIPPNTAAPASPRAMESAPTNAPGASS